MHRTIKILNTDFQLALYNATVIHANKYTEAQGGMFNLPVVSTLHIDVVFRLEDKQDLKIYIKNIDVPVYTNQEVHLICINETVIGFIEVQTNHYYYTTKDLTKLTGNHIPYLWVWVVALLGLMVVYFITGEYITLWSFLPFIAAQCFYSLHKWLTNYRIKKAIDAELM
jgi:hypothetical protein